MIKLRQQSFKPITEGCCKVSDSTLTLFFWLLSSSAVLSCSPPTIVRKETNLSWALITCVKGSELCEWAKPSQDSWISMGKQREFFVSFQQHNILISKNTHVHTQRHTYTPLLLTIIVIHKWYNYCSKRVRKCSEYFCVCVWFSLETYNKCTSHCWDAHLSHLWVCACVCVCVSPLAIRYTQATCPTCDWLHRSAGLLWDKCTHTHAHTKQIHMVTGLRVACCPPYCFSLLF